MAYFSMGRFADALLAAALRFAIRFVPRIRLARFRLVSIDTRIRRPLPLPAAGEGRGEGIFNNFVKSGAGTASTVNGPVCRAVQILHRPAPWLAHR